MYKLGKLKISGKLIVYLVLFYTIIMETLIHQFHFPDFIRYFNDFLVLLLVPLILKSDVSDFFRKNGNRVIIVIILFYFIISLFTSLLNTVSPLLVIWAIRNTFRGIVFFLAVALYLKKEDLPKLFNILLIVQAVNLLLAIYQFGVLHHAQDYIGGIFGYGNGAAVNIFNALLISYFLIRYLKKKEGILKLIFSVVSSIAIAAMAEEKATYIFIVVVLIAGILLTGFSFRKLIAVISLVFVTAIGLSLLGKYYPGSVERLIDAEFFMDYATTTYETGYRLPRLGSFSVIEKIFFSDDIFLKLFGIGFGNAETSSFSFLQSKFYLKYGDYNYRWFTHQWTFIEEGYIGFISFLMIFISILFCLFKNKKKYADNFNIIIAICTTLCCIVTIWYNTTLKVDMQYLAYFSMGIGFIVSGDKKIVKTNSKYFQGGNHVQ